MGNCDRPTFQAPINYVDCLENIAGYDKNGNEQVLRKGAGLLYGADGNVCARWHDGSDEQPIIMPNVTKSGKAVAGVIGIQSNGRWIWLTRPDGSTGRHILVEEAGSVFFRKENSAATEFNQEDIEEAKQCGDPLLAVFEACEGDDKYHLRFLNAAELNTAGTGVPKFYAIHVDTGLPQITFSTTREANIRIDGIVYIVTPFSSNLYQAWIHLDGVLGGNGLSATGYELYTNLGAALFENVAPGDHTATIVTTYGGLSTKGGFLNVMVWEK